MSFRSPRRPLLYLFSLILCSSLAALLAASAQAEDSLAEGPARLLADGFRFTEGPAVNEFGDVYFTDIPNNRIHIWGVTGKLSVFREDSGAANGLYFDDEGHLLTCEGGNRRVTSISPDGTVNVLADSYQGKKLNSPNDLWIDPRGGVYFSDPRFGSMEGLEQDGMHVYYISPDRSQPLRRVTSYVVKPNGVLGTADGKRLFVADRGSDKTFVYRIEDDGSLSDRRTFCEQSSDGLTMDERGNLYLTVTEGIAIYSPEGKKLETIAIPEPPTNMTFGGPQRNVLFVTARKSFHAVPMKVRGQYGPKQ